MYMVRFSWSILCRAGYQLFAEPAVQTADDVNEGVGWCCTQGPIQGADRPSPSWAGKAGLLSSL